MWLPSHGIGLHRVRAKPPDDDDFALTLGCGLREYSFLGGGGGFRALTIGEDDGGAFTIIGGDRDLPSKLVVGRGEGRDLQREDG
jgi:hypothetical protein